VNGQPRPRASVAALGGYHSPQVAARVRLNTNESPYPPPHALLEALAGQVMALPLHRYPDREATAARAGLAARFGLGPEHVWVANGSNEVIQSLLLAFGGPRRRALTFEPTYQLHGHIARLTGTKVACRARAEDFTLLPETVAAAIQAERPDVVFLCSPNNPTGTVDPAAVLDAALTLAPGIVIVDEAYAEFSGQAGAVGHVPYSDRLAVVRTFSKAWSLAGVRVGYLIASQAIVEAVRSVALPYHLDALSQAAAELSLPYEAELEARVVAIIAGRHRLEAGLASEPAVRVYPSGANFLLFRPDADADAVWRGLVDRGVLVRNCAGWAGLDNCLRVTVGSPDENEMFLTTLQASLSALAA